MAVRVLKHANHSAAAVEPHAAQSIGSVTQRPCARARSRTPGACNFDVDRLKIAILSPKHKVQDRSVGYGVRFDALVRIQLDSILYVRARMRQRAQEDAGKSRPLGKTRDNSHKLARPRALLPPQPSWALDVARRTAASRP